MKKTLLKKLFFTFNIILIMCIFFEKKTLAQTWQVLGSSTLPNSGTATYTKVTTTVISNVVVPYMVYADANVIKVKRYINFAWEAVGGNVSDGALATHCAIAISGTGIIYVAYRDDSNSKFLAVKQYNSSNSTWEAVGGSRNSIYANALSVDYGFAYGTGYQISLSIDNNNIPYVSYVENGTTVYVKKFIVNVWTIVGTSSVVTSTNKAYSPTLNFDANNNAYLVYHELESTSSGSIRVFKFNGTSWGDLTIGTTFTLSRNVSSVIDRVNKRLIINYAYAGNGTRSTILYYTYEAVAPAVPTWSQTVTGGTFIGWGNKAATYNNITVDKLGNAYAVWVDDMASTVTKMPFMKKLTSGGLSWVEVNNPSTTGGVLGPYDVAKSYTYSANGAEGTPFIVFVKSGNPIAAGFSAVNLNTVNILPIKLKSFLAKAGSNDVKVEWITTTEINNSKFVVERSTDGQNFLKLGEVAAKGASAYSFLDHSPTSGNNYYRLVQYDLDGKSESFGPVAVNFVLKSTTSLVAYPNPTPESISFNAAGLNGNFEVMLLDLSGKVIHKENITTTGESNHTVNIKQKPVAGQYILQVSGKGFYKSTAIIVL